MGESQPNSAGKHNESEFRRVLKLIRNPRFLGLLVFLLAATIFWVVYSSRPVKRPSFNPFGPGPYRVVVKVSESSAYGDELEIKVVRIYQEDQAYKVNAQVTYRKGETTTVTAKKGAIITFPRESGYDITVEDISDEEATFSIKKHGEVRN